ncbi:MAG: uncharacterized protein QOJ39_3743 [Candidatus Eremiobacteraeota bacterium]|jgi:phage tail sheath protein FI|nr:uncharacterized protein [Candidatus Eremiobacteraeota bacterium]
MPELLHPGVYVQEVSSGLQPIQGVSTSTAAFIGVTDKGPIPGTKLPAGRAAQPGLVTSMSDYLRRYGGFRTDSFLTYAVQAFYQNGGKRLYIVRVAKNAKAAALGSSLSPISPPTPADALPISAASEGLWGNNIWISFSASSGGAPNTFRLNVMYGTTDAEAKQNVVESYDNVTVASASPADPLPSNYVGTVVNSRSEYIAFPPITLASPAVTVIPGPLPSSRFPLIGGSDGDVANVDFIGSAAADSSITGTGLYALDKITDVSLLAIPGRGDTTTLNAGIEYCKNQRPLNDCFFISDVGFIADVKSARSSDATASVVTIADARSFAVTGIDKSAGDYGAIYFPWVFAPDPIGAGSNPKILLPPSGFVTGIYARTDNSRGVFKAPAGTEAGVAGALGPFVQVSDTEQDVLNPVSLNVIRTVPTSGLVVWGARTIGSDAEWRYVPVRRMAIFLRTSIYYGIQWAVFEPNAEPLWASLRLNVRAFMLTQFRAGAFKGVKPSDAFFVLCDETTTTATDIDNGVVNILVGFAPLKPAEFVVLKLSQIVNQPAS